MHELKSTDLILDRMKEALDSISIEEILIGLINDSDIEEVETVLGRIKEKMAKREKKS